jgi:hypothetical protein
VSETPKSAQLGNTRLKLKMHANLSAAFGLTGEFSIFEIWDEKASVCSFYTYWAGGVSKGLLAKSWLSATMPGDWNDFEVSDKIQANEFGGATRFTTGGALWWTKNWINFMGLPRGIATVPNPLPLETGVTIGAGAGTTAGQLRLELLGTPDGLLPFKGP